MPPRSHNAWVSATALSIAAAHGAYLLLRPRSGTITATPVPAARYFAAADVARARAYERPQLRLHAAGALLHAAGLAAGVRSRRTSPLSRRHPLAAAAGAAGLALALTAQSLPLAAAARRRALAAGLATQSWRGWALDVGRAAAIGAGFAAAAGATGCLLVRRYGERWWLPAAAGSVGAAALVSFAAPLLLDPIFNDFEPLADGVLRDGLLDLARRAGVGVREVLVIDASRRTRALNAYVAGVGATRRVVLFDTLLERFGPAEVEVVVAHELSHVRHRDVLRGLAFMAIVAAPAARAAAALAARLEQGAPDTGPSAPALALGGGLVATLIGPLARRLSRAVERRADSFALELTGDPDAFIAFEQAIARTNLTDPEPPAWQMLLLATHPSAVERIGIAAAYTAGARATPRPPRRLLRRTAGRRCRP